MYIAENKYCNVRFFQYHVAHSQYTGKQCTLTEKRITFMRIKVVLTMMLQQKNSLFLHIYPQKNSSVLLNLIIN